MDGVGYCYTLEDAPGKGSVPAGTYEVRVTWSPRFKRQLPLLINVPGRDGIRIHAGNTHKDTLGCVLVGQEVNEDRLLFSQAALGPLIAKIVGAHDCFITIEDPA
jgi:hypothetical protein